MQYLAICEDDLLFQFMRNVADEQGEVRYLVPNDKIARAIKRQGGKVWHGDLLKEETYKKVKLHYIDQAIVFIRDGDLQDRVCRLLRSLDKMVSIVSLTSDNNGNHKEPADPLLRQAGMSATMFVISEAAFQVRLGPDRKSLEWHIRTDQGDQVFTEEPDTSWWQRTMLHLVGPFIPEGQL